MSYTTQSSRPFCLLVLAFLGATALFACRRVEVHQATPEPRAKVDVITVAGVSSPEILRLTGNLRGTRETDLAANVSGRIMKTLVERGTRVRKGDTLAVVDVSAAALQLAEARVQVVTSQTQLTIDRSDCGRYQQLKQRGATTDMEYDQVMARCTKSPLAIEAARARERIAAKSVGDGIIRAPFAGIITERAVDIGEYVQPSTKVVSLAEVDSLRLEFSVPEANYPSVRIGQDVEFRVVAYNDRTFQGRIVHVGGAVRTTRDVLVEAEVKNESGSLLPGMFANLSVSLGLRMLPGLPRTVVFEQNGKSNAFVIKNGALEQRVLQLAERSSDSLPVLHGVSIGDTVATYQPGLKNGQLVQ
jgi:RND family efflux transporter MFP subunit